MQSDLFSERSIFSLVAARCVAGVTKMLINTASMFASREKGLIILAETTGPLPFRRQELQPWRVGTRRR